MRIVSKASAIVAALAAAFCLVGCGQRGPLYMPKVPPLPASAASSAATGTSADRATGASAAAATDRSIDTGGAAASRRTAIPN
ncbi:lipoprotein-attachment site-containing protein [Chitinasiproducens palmae]|uniref:Lipoprotein-attachment site-containing protein n=1 Tax=Chitinasiproducens palmae TaxID=1770053 RepID=A0A1H2PVN1_9BURK|nr:lipoprotein-attachment site-containing protein [Chitinasiproducens palmae]